MFTLYLHCFKQVPKKKKCKTVATMITKNGTYDI